MSQKEKPLASLKNNNFISACTDQENYYKNI